MLRYYTLNTFAQQLNDLKVDGFWITLMDNFSGIKTDIALKYQHTWVFPVYVINARLQK